jgi:sRNA-binding carbon storage regulator CsrA
MLVLTARRREKVYFPDLHTCVEVLSIQPSSVRLGIAAPDDVRVLRQGLPDRLAEWGEDPETAGASAVERLDQLVQKRLEVSRRVLAEARRHLRAGHAEYAGALLEKVDEDMHLLRCRLRREAGQAECLA